MEIHCMVGKSRAKRDLRLQALGVERVLLGVSRVIWYLGRRWRRGSGPLGPEGSDLEYSSKIL
jgi:hypothetical protein